MDPCSLSPNIPNYVQMYVFLHCHYVYHLPVPKEFSLLLSWNNNALKWERQKFFFPFLLLRDSKSATHDEKWSSSAAPKDRNWGGREAQIIWFQSAFLTNTTGHDLITLAKGENLSFGKTWRKISLSLALQNRCCCKQDEEGPFSPVHCSVGIPHVPLLSSQLGTRGNWKIRDKNPFQARQRTHNS